MTTNSIDLYSQQAAIYDLIYSYKDYLRECQQLVEVLKGRGVTQGQSLLDVGCGTGGHLRHLRHEFWAEGLDFSPEMLKIAKLKGCERLHQGDMRDFRIQDGGFKAIVSMFSAISYVQTIPALFQTLKCFASHVVEGGVVVVEPWYTKNQFTAGKITARAYDDGKIGVARTSYSRLAGDWLSAIDFHYSIVREGEGMSQFSETHLLGLFDSSTMIEAFETAGLGNVEYLPTVAERGVYVGTKL